MKRITILLSLCLMLSAQAFCQDSVKLEYKYTVGELLKYKMVMDAKLQLDVPSTGKSLTMPMRMAGVVKQRTKRVLSDGSAELLVAFESMRMQVGTEVREMPVKELPNMTMTVTKCGQVCNAGFPGMNSSGFMGSQLLNSGGFGNYAILPATDLQVGDAWSLEVPEIPGVGTIRGNAKLTSTNSKVGKYKTATIVQSIGGNLDMDMPMALGVQGDSAAPPGMKMNGAFLGDGTVYFSVERGQLIRTDGRIDLQVNVNLPSFEGQNVGNASATMQMTYEVFLLPADKAK